MPKASQTQTQKRKPKPKPSPWLCKCGCGKMIRDARTQAKHLQGIGPAVVQVQYALRTAAPNQTRVTDWLPTVSPIHTPIRATQPPPLHDNLSPNLSPFPTAFNIEESHDVIDDQPVTETVQSNAPQPQNFTQPLITENLDRRVVAESEEALFPSLHPDDDQAGSPSDGEEPHDAEWDREEELLEFSRSLEDLNAQNSAYAHAVLTESFEAEVSRLRQAGCLTDEEMDYIQAFNYKVDTCIPASALEKLPHAFKKLSSLPSLFRLQSRISQLAGISPILIDCCINSCCAFTAQYEPLEECPFCSEPRRDHRSKARKKFSYMPITNRLTHFFSQEATAVSMDYRGDYKHTEGQYSDIFDGSHYQHLLQTQVSVNGKQLPHKFFSDRRDIALGLSVDGFCPWKHRKQTCWPIILFNYNLPPDIRFHLRNILCVGVIPGPKQMKDLDSFMVPLVKEMGELAAGVPAFDIRTISTFLFHAYLIIAFGDIPAVAKLMRMKGHNAKCPCRACLIVGVRIEGSSNPIHYVPIQALSEPHTATSLPLRTHTQFLTQAREVSNAPSNAASERLAVQYGIKGIPVLAALSSIEFPTSFPHDFMHLVWENVMKSLVLLWTGEYRDVDKAGDRAQPYILEKTVWNAIGEATAASGGTIPSAFGRRVPNIADNRHEFTAEAWSVWTIFLGPILLEGRFSCAEYYTHFVALVRLINICLRFEISHEDVEMLRDGFAKWVMDYERLYYQHKPSRLPTCTINIHALLHIADGIKACGPVWCYWAYPMERFCGSLLRTVKSRRFPFASLDKRVRDLAWLDHIKKVYNLSAVLDLSRRRTVEERGLRVPRYDCYVLLIRKNISVSGILHQRIANHMGVVYNVTSQVAGLAIPQSLDVYGKMQILEGGDMIHASKVLVAIPGCRDATWVKYIQLVDIHARNHRRPPNFIKKTFFGQVQYFIVLHVHASSGLHTNESKTHVLAAILPCKIESTSVTAGHAFYSQTAAMEVIDVKLIEGLVGRVQDPRTKKWCIIEREGIYRQIELADEDEVEQEAAATLIASGR